MNPCRNATTLQPISADLNAAYYVTVSGNNLRGWSFTETTFLDVHTEAWKQCRHLHELATVNHIK